MNGIAIKRTETNHETLTWCKDVDLPHPDWIVGSYGKQGNLTAP